MQNWKKTKISSVKTFPVQIVSNASIASHGTGNGRMIPLIIINTANRTDIEEFVKQHEYSKSGDMSTIWGKTHDKKYTLVLYLAAKRPSECEIILEFDLFNQWALVDLIISAQSLYLQPGRPGDRLSNKYNAPKILVEVPSKDFEKEWNKILLECLIKDLKREKFRPKDAGELSRKIIEETRKISNIRI